MKTLDAIAKEVGSSLADVLVDAITRADELRSSAKHDASPTEGPADLHEQLVNHRKALDAIEDIAAKLGRLKARTDRAVRVREDELEDALAKASQLQEEYSTAKERNAHLDMQTVDERIALRKARNQRDEVAEAHEYVRTLHRGLDGSRRDLDSRIRLITLQTSLER